MKTETDLLELLGRKEPLHDDLKPYVQDGPVGPCLKHPLVFEMFLRPELAAMTNARYLQTKRRVEKLDAAGKFHKAVWCYERPHRLDAIAERAHRMPARRYWRALGHALTDSENLWQYRGVLRGFLFPFTPDARLRPLMMSRKERRALAALPGAFLVYRGCRGHNRAGWSWTLSEEKARWFARRFGKEGIVRAGTVAKAKVLAHFLGRGEDEVLVPPGAVRGVRETVVRDRSAAAIADAVKLLKGEPS